MNAALGDRLFDRDRDAEDDSPWAPLRWGLCFALVAGLHVGGAWMAAHWHPAAEPSPAPPPAAVMVDLLPLPAAPPAPPNEIPPGPTQEIAPPPPPPEPVEEPILPPAPPAPAPEIDLPVPPKPKPKPPQPHRQTIPRELPELPPDDKPPAPVTTAPPRVQAPPAPAVAAPAPGAAAARSANAMPTWQGLLLRRLEQFKRYPGAAQLRHEQGTAYLRFAMDRQGRVLSASIARSSGFAALDEETLALVHRAEPLPAPPPEVPGNPIELVVPVQFFLR
ncbi:MAG TPA: energy transducer TonB [Stellaceae bacterium]|nr:energy transducer TonB [Stellaceae bacterium]